MKNFRRGFTMIELIFVIVLIGILAAVATPKLAKTTTEAKKKMAIGFIGTLNRTASSSMWVEVQDKGGSVKNLKIEDYIDLPEGITIDLSACDVPAKVVGTINTDTLPNEENIYCLDGTAVNAPKFGFAIMDNNSSDLNTSLQNN